jgi:hypothetical protein
MTIFDLNKMIVDHFYLNKVIVDHFNQKFLIIDHLIMVIDQLFNLL